jgi:hypothetical protein
VVGRFRAEIRCELLVPFVPKVGAAKPPALVELLDGITSDFGLSSRDLPSLCSFKVPVVAAETFLEWVF